MFFLGCFIHVTDPSDFFVSVEFWELEINQGFLLGGEVAAHGFPNGFVATPTTSAPVLDKLSQEDA